MQPRLPTFFLSHGGGPCFWIDMPLPARPSIEQLRAQLAGLLGTLPARPSAFLVISGHWEEAVATVNVGAAPPMLYDYYNFPAHTYELQYPAPGDPALAGRVRHLLSGAGIAVAEERARGFDHGVFVPFLIIDPPARIPVVELSLRRDLDPAAHLAIGRALAPLRDEGVLIVGSGNSFHNLRTFFDGDPRAATLFDDWLDETLTREPPAARADRLCHWDTAPAARACHPREEHLLPLMVAVGAAGDDPGTRILNMHLAGKANSSFSFGV